MPFDPRDVSGAMRIVPKIQNAIAHDVMLRFGVQGGRIQLRIELNAFCEN